MKRRATVDQVFGEILRELRTKSGKTQEQMALDAGLDRTYISMLERGLRQPTLKTLVALSGTLDIAVSEIIAKAEDKLKN